MYRPLTCPDYYGGSVTVPDIQRSAPHSLTAFRFRQSPFTCLVTVGVMDCRMRFPSFTIYHGCSAASSCCIRIFSPEQYRSMTISATLRHSLKVGQLGLSFKQFGFHPHIHRFILPFSGSLDLIKSSQLFLSIYTRGCSAGSLLIMSL